MPPCHSQHRYWPHPKVRNIPQSFPQISGGHFRTSALPHFRDTPAKSHSWSAGTPLKCLVQAGWSICDMVCLEICLDTCLDVVAVWDSTSCEFCCQDCADGYGQREACPNGSMLWSQLFVMGYSACWAWLAGRSQCPDFNTQLGLELLV